MANRQQAERELERLGFRLDPDSGKSPTLGWSATIDPIGRVSVSNECRGVVIVEGNTTAPRFWQMVIDMGREYAPYLAPCPEDPGCCEFHDEELEPLP